MITDVQIQQDVMAELKWQPILNASEIGVAVKDGIVTLFGKVNSFAKKKAAEKAVKKIKGVKAIAEDIEVVLKSKDGKDDTEIAEAILYAIKWNAYIPDEKVMLKVENGWVILEGEVDWDFQKQAITKVVSSLVGVRGITNLIRVIPTVTPKDIKYLISNALHRSATFDGAKINVTVDGGKVVLTGTVRSLAEKNDAENAAWLSPGINWVENRIEVDTSIYAY